MTDPLDLARDLAAHGVPVFTAAANPGYVPQGQEPEYRTPREWQHTEPAPRALDTWTPGDALCLVTGHGLDAVDIDPRNGADPAAQHDRLLALGVPIVAVTFTPGKGAHFYVPSVGLCSSANPRTGVDFRGRGLDGSGSGFLYLPGTRRPKYRGAGYTWEVTPRWEIVDDLDDDDRHEIRDALAAYLSGNGIRPRTRAQVTTDTVSGEEIDPDALRPWLRDLLADIGPTWEVAGGTRSTDRSERFHHLVAACRRAGLTQGQTVSALEPWCETVGKFVGRVEDEVARSWPKVAPESEGNAMPDEIRGPVTDAETRTDPPEGDDIAPEEPSTWRPVDLTAYLDGTYVAPTTTLLPRTDGVHLIYPGRVHSFHGESESGKSLILQAEMVRAMRDGLRVLMLDFEDDAGPVVERMRRMGATVEDLTERFTYVRPHEGIGATADGVAAYASLLSQRFDLAVIDGVTDAMGLWSGGMASSSDNDAISGFLRAFPRRLARATGAAVCLIDHVAKDADSRGRFALGGQAKMAALDGAAFMVEVVEVCGVGLRGVLSLRIAKDRPGAVRPTCGAWRKKDRSQEAARIVVDSTEEGRTVVAVEPPRVQDPGEGFRPTALMEKVSRFLETAPVPVSKQGVRDGITGNAKAKDDALEVLVGEGYVARSSGLRGALLHTSVRAYRQGEDPESDAYLRPLTGSTSSGTRSSTTSTPDPTSTSSRSIDPGRQTRSEMGDSTPSRTRSGRGQDGVGIWPLTDPESLDLATPRHACAGDICQVVGCPKGTAATA